MEIVNLLEAKSRVELREWLIRNYRTETECWVVVKRGRPKDDGTFWYIDAVEEAMCFGWIDSTTKRREWTMAGRYRNFVHEEQKAIGRN